MISTSDISRLTMRGLESSAETVGSSIKRRIGASFVNTYSIGRAIKISSISVIFS